MNTNNGWKLVPIEPTSEMVKAAFDQFEINAPGFAVGNDARRAIYAAMLAAAPAPAASAQDDAKDEPAVTIAAIDEYGPQLHWNKHWVEFGVGTKFYAAPAAGDAKDDLTLAQKYEDACIAANANAQDAARWRKAVSLWRVKRIEVFYGIHVANPKGISWDDLTRQVDAALAASQQQEG